MHRFRAIQTGGIWDVKKSICTAMGCPWDGGVLPLLLPLPLPLLLLLLLLLLRRRVPTTG